MSANWQRWLRYAKAKLDSTLKESEADLDQREARLRAEAEGKPWLSSESEAPTLDEMRARIEHDAREAAERQRRPAPGSGPEPSRPGPRLEGGPGSAPPAGATPGAAPADGVSTGAGEDPLASFDMAAHQRAADDRLAAIRQELGLSDDASDPGPSPPDRPGDEDDPPDDDRPGDDRPGDEDDPPATPIAPV